MNKKESKLIYNYETKIKDLRKDYYKKIALNNQSNITLFILNYLPIIIVILILSITSFKLISYLISLLVLLILCLITKYLKKNIFKIEDNEYLKSIRKIGYFNIAQFENDLKRYVTGPTGYYEKKLEELKVQHNINEKTKIFEDINNEKYYVWFDNKTNSLHVLSQDTSKTPKIKSTRLSHIRYYRKNSQNLILKTDLDLYIFKTQDTSFFDSNIPNKKFENFVNINYEECITDFEIFMHKIRNNFSDKRVQLQSSKSYLLSKILVILIILSLIIVGVLALSKYKSLCIIASLIMLLTLNITLNDFFNLEPSNKEDELSIIKKLNNDLDCQTRFNELKVILNIKDSYDTIYSIENVPYLAWTSNGYFHVFLNIIYFNIVYMSIKLKDVNYYKCSKKECEVSTKLKTLYFNLEAKSFFDKILPNKDYEWINGINSSNK